MIRFRPHHFLCTLGFQGKGYSPSFVRNFSTIVKRLNLEDGDQELIKVVSACDDICRACPSRREKQCLQEKQIQKIDRAHATALEIETGEQLSWGAAKELLKEKMTDEQFQEACGECRWREHP